MKKQLLFATILLIGIVMNSQIANTPSSIEICDDEVTDGVTIFDLTVSEPEILGSQNASDYIISYYTSSSDADNAINPITNATSYTNTLNPQTLFVRLEDVSTSNYDSTALTIRVLVTPAAAMGTPVDLSVCDESFNSGFANFDLTINEGLINPSGEPFMFTYHTNESDALLGMNAIPNPTNFTNINTNAPQIIYVRVEGSNGCFSLTNFLIIVNPLPELVAVSDYLFCELNTDGFAEFDLDLKIPEILNGQDPLDFSVSFYLTQSDAQQMVNPLMSPFTNFSNPQSIYVTVLNNVTGCFRAVVSFNIEVLDGAQANPDGEAILYEICDNNVETDGDTTNDSAQFDLSTLNSSVLDGQNPIDFFVSYHQSEFDANLGINQLPLLYQNITNPQLLFVRVESFLCFDVTSATIQVNELPSSNLENEYEVCNGETLVLDTGLTSSGGYQFSWEKDFVFISSDATLTVTEGGVYTVSITDLNTNTMCSSQYSTTVSFIVCTDTDSDGVNDSEEDVNLNGNLDDDDTDMDSIPNYLDDDDDGDNVDTIIEISISTGRSTNRTHNFVDTDNDLIENYLDDDDDGDLVLTIDEDYNNNGDPTDDDTNMNSIPDYLEAAVALSVLDFSITNFNMFPNPAKDKVTIRLHTNNFGNVTVKIIDIQGKLILEQHVSEGNNLELDTADLQSGLYFVKLNTNNKSLVKKLIIE